MFDGSDVGARLLCVGEGIGGGACKFRRGGPVLTYTLLVASTNHDSLKLPNPSLTLKCVYMT